MLTRIRRLPSPALVISAIALIFAIGGGAFAIASSDNTKDKKIAKKVANKQITKRAPGLSVSHAGSADTATNATNATNADHANNADHATSADSAGSATNATNASELGGVAASAYPTAAKISFSGPDTDPADGAPHHTVLSLGGLTLGVSCINLPPDVVSVFANAAAGTLRGSYVEGTTAHSVDTHLSGSVTPMVLADTQPGFGAELTFSDSSRVIAIDLDGAAGETPNTCDLHGVAMVPGS